MGQDLSARSWIVSFLSIVGLSACDADPGTTFLESEGVNTNKMDHEGLLFEVNYISVRLSETEIAKYLAGVRETYPNASIVGGHGTYSEVTGDRTFKGRRRFDWPGILDKELFRGNSSPLEAGSQIAITVALSVGLTPGEVVDEEAFERGEILINTENCKKPVGLVTVMGGNLGNRQPRMWIEYICQVKGVDDNPSGICLAAPRGRR